MLEPVNDVDQRCWWPGTDLAYQNYHDHEWGRVVSNNVQLFEKVCLEGFQAGLSWLTILRKRENFREAFAGFDVDQLVTFDDADVDRLMSNAGIVRHRGKIEAVLNNAVRCRELHEEGIELSKFLWSFAPRAPYGQTGLPTNGAPIASISPEAIALSQNLKKRGWKFVGPTTMYSMMQSMGMVNDHVTGCFVRDECEHLRQQHLEHLSRAAT